MPSASYSFDITQLKTFEAGKGARALRGQAGRANPAAAADKADNRHVSAIGNHRPSSHSALEPSFNTLFSWSLFSDRRRMWWMPDHVAHSGFKPLPADQRANER
jgi:hypothetical protein